jgi:hypothetical protein
MGLDYLRRLAIHEAGHVIVRALSNLSAPQAVRIGAGIAAVETHGLPFMTPETAEEVLKELMAGRVTGHKRQRSSSKWRPNGVFHRVPPSGSPHLLS